MTFGQGCLDGGLARQQPVERGVEFVVIDRAEAEPFAEAGGRRGGREAAGGGKLGGGIEDAANQHGQDEVAATIAVWAEDGVEADLAGGAERGGDVTMRQTTGDGEGVALGGGGGDAPDPPAQALDGGRGAGGPVGQGV